MKKLISIILLITLITGCGLSAREQLVTQAAFFGGVSGATFGSVLGKMLKKDPVMGAFIGGILGAIAGASYASHVANKKAEFRTPEAYLDACINDMQIIQERTSQYDVYLRKELQHLNQADKQQLYLYNSDENKKIGLTEGQRQIQIVLEVVVKQMKRADDEVLIQSEVLKREKQDENQSQERLTILETQIKQLEQQLAMLYEDMRILLK